MSPSTQPEDQPGGEPVEGVRILGRMEPGFDEILSPEALGFVAKLVRRFRPRVTELLARRAVRQAEFDAGALPDFLAETAEIRQASWKVSPAPPDLQDRRVEITGPVDRKMVINALNSGASMFMADFEDSNSPTWSNVVAGQVNLRDAVAGTIRHVAPDSGKVYALADDVATLLVRPRGWHLVEAHLLVDDAPATAGLVDFGLYFFHNVAALRAKGTGPYFYLPKLQSHLEARLWNDVFLAAQEALGVPRGTIKATVLIETLPAAFEMDEILWELREHSAGLNCGRWDYIFSCIKTFRARSDKVLPDRSLIGMTQPFMRAYTSLVIATCHRRGAHAMGGMAAQIPIKGDASASDEALARVREDKLREVRDGHDGTWVAHPGLVGLAKEIFDAHMPTPNQLHVLRQDVSVGQSDLVTMPDGPRTEDGLRLNVRVGIQYLEAWIGGNGCVPLYHLMEDAATAEISRAQVWQWLHNSVSLAWSDGSRRRLDAALLEAVVGEELDRIRAEVGDARFDSGRFPEATELFVSQCNDQQMDDFLTLRAYELLTAETARPSAR